MPTLDEVFGISNKVPQYTYVDRAGLDDRFRRYLTRERHIVIYGASKQGKTVLRKRWLSLDKTVVIQCASDTNRERVYTEILAKLNVKATSQHTESYTVNAETEAHGQVGAKVPLVASGELGVIGNLGGSVSSEHVTVPVNMDASNISLVASEILKSGKRCVIEDFHYLDENEQRAFARDLKAFWDLGVFFIVVGIWAEENLLSFYNGDLAGRVEDVDVVWSRQELLSVLEKGESALNIGLTQHLKDSITANASENVGLLHRLAERFCEACQIEGTQSDNVMLSDDVLLHECMQEMCKKEASRYRQFYDTIVNGFRKRELEVYRHIAHVLLDATDDELKQGINVNELLTRVQKRNSRIRRSDFAQALNRIDRLQIESRISPIVFSYNQNLDRVVLVDRELLFYRKHAFHLPWIEDEHANG